ncbi:hypothetical protein M1B72_21050 [Geomonas paludis]|uniref:Uncharacterized protein n=1 Tax=Geomonas paludis TaxID=2740185 RepID=A0ABY4LD28_9BACT|nr:hypothetical protein [Geomonas paludis]UPU35898.1 hypothetical protein M1B72_21050 [Geomonas paludis]
MTWNPLAKVIRTANVMMVLGFPFAALLVVTYFKYETSQIFKAFGDVFIEFSFGKRDKRDLLIFALIPLSIAIFGLIFRVMML